MTVKKIPKQKILLIRLSSLGDVILSTSALSALLPWKEGLEIHWVVAQEYAALFEGHPWVDHLHPFDRTQGWRGWVALVKWLWKEKYRFVFDLHGSLRSRLLMACFWLWKQQTGRKIELRSLSKQRWRFYGYCLFKAYWPVSWRPRPWVERYAQCVGGTGAERPHLHHLVTEKASVFPLPPAFREALPKNAVGVMPGSRWLGKRWSVDSYVRWLEKSSFFPVIFGTSTDAESFLLVRQLQEKGLPFLSCVGQLTLPQTARVLSQVVAYVGGDTGLAHLAESVGTPAWVLYGPTVSDLGFGPWRDESRSLGLPLSCRPCGRDGRFCYRFWDSRACLKKLPPELLWDLETTMDN